MLLVALSHLLPPAFAGRLRRCGYLHDQALSGWLPLKTTLGPQVAGDAVPQRGRERDYRVVLVEGAISGLHERGRVEMSDLGLQGADSVITSRGQ